MGTLVWAGVGLACLVVGVLGVVILLGLALPRDHVAASEGVVHAARGEVWRAISDLAEGASWRTGISRVERGEDIDGMEVWIEHSRFGPMAMGVRERVEDKRLVVEIVDQRLAFGGAWTYEIEDAGEGTRVRITERGFIRNPIFRFLARFVFGYRSAQRQYLEDLGRRFGGVEKVRAVEEVR